MSNEFGDWKVSGVDDSIYCFVYSDKESDSNALSYQEIACCAGGYLVAESIKRGAQSRLISLAPRMLSLLEELVDIEGDQPGDYMWGRKVNEIIKEIKGE